MAWSIVLKTRIESKEKSEIWDKKKKERREQFDNNFHSQRAGTNEQIASSEEVRKMINNEYQLFFVIHPFLMCW